MPHRSSLPVAAVLAIGLCALPASARAGEATDQIRVDIEQLYGAVREAPAANADREAAPVLDAMFDWSRMAETALGGHWRARSPAEREEFTKLFAGLFRRAYVSRIHLVDASSFQYLGDSVAGGRTIVKTRITTKKGSPLGVDYVTRLGAGQRWRVEDVRVEGISLMDNYRTQFDSIITRSSYAALVDRLRGGGK